VTPGHEKHCAQYNACGRPVYFVRDDWHYNEYVPRHRHGGDDMTMITGMVGATTVHHAWYHWIIP
jgi:hypothetical protein